jgi:hypothetical protein
MVSSGAILELLGWSPVIHEGLYNIIIQAVQCTLLDSTLVVVLCSALGTWSGLQRHMRVYSIQRNMFSGAGAVEC